jgi:hypothetical protein
MKRYDDQNGTGFASRFDTSDPDSAPTMLSAEAAWMTHQAQKAPTELLEELVSRLKELKADTLKEQADFLEPNLRAIKDTTETYIEWIDSYRKRQERISRRGTK